MKNFRALIQVFEELRTTIVNSLPEVATSVSLAGKAIVERTIKEKGFGAKYSQNLAPAWLFENKSLNNSGRTYIKNVKKSDNPYTNWGNFRKAQGLQNSYVDLTYSGAMWRSMFPDTVQVSGYKYVAPLSSNTYEGKKAMYGNSKRYGDFIGKILQSDNVDVLGEVAQDELVRIVEDRLK